MRDYRELTRRLEGERNGELPLNFTEVEQIIRSDLPESARRHQAWWANTETHSHAAAWMRPGWRTSRVDMPGQRVTFVRAASSPRRAVLEPVEPSEPAAEPASALEPAKLPGLYPGAMRMLEVIAEEKGISLREAVVNVLNEAAIERQRRLYAELDTMGPGIMGTSSAEMIREAREERFPDA